MDGIDCAPSRQAPAGPRSTVESTPRITPRVRRWRTSARVSMSLMTGCRSCARKSSASCLASASCWRAARTRERPGLRYNGLMASLSPSIGAVVADLGVRKDDDLSGVGGIGEDFLISGDGGIEDYFTGAFCARTKTTALEDCSVFQGEDRCVQ